MKKHLIIALLSMIACTASAQKLTSGDYTATISNIKTRSYTQEFVGEMRDIEEFIGNFTIEKKGSRISSQKFSTFQMGKGMMTLRIKDEESNNHTFDYIYDTKKYEFEGDEYKAKSTKDIDNIILSGILIYAQWLDTIKE